MNDARLDLQRLLARELLARASQDATTIAARPTRDRARAILAHGTETLLVAEDEPRLRDVIAHSLTGLGYTVVVARDGEEAAAAFAARPGEISLAILDVVMPRLGGPETFLRMKALEPGLPVLFMTGYAPERSRLTSLASRARVLDKPFNLTDLAANVRAVLDP